MLKNAQDRREKRIDRNGKRNRFLKRCSRQGMSFSGIGLKGFAAASNWDIVRAEGFKEAIWQRACIHAGRGWVHPMNRSRDGVK